MSDSTTPPPSEKQVFVAPINIGRLWTLTIVNLTLNIVILVVIFIGVIGHHRDMPRDRMAMHGPGFGGPGPGFTPPGPRPPGPNDHPAPPPPAPPAATSNQSPPSPAARMTDNIMNHLEDQLALTDDQAAKIKPLVAQQLQDFQAQIQAHQPVTPQQIEAAKAEIRPFLQPGQQQALDAIPVPHHFPMPGGPPNPGAGT
jgi:hypothetical protein